MLYAPGPMSPARRLHYDYAEYLRSLEMSELKLEYCDGVIYAMPGGTRAHAQLGAAVIVALARTLPESCRLATSNQKVRIDVTDLSTFPDVSVVCGPGATSEIDPDAITNPTLLVEVTSKSTEDYDRGEKLSHYKQLDSVRVVLFVSHRTKRITCIERDGAGWTERDVRGGEVLTLREPAIALAVDDVYDGIELDAR